MRIRTRGDRTGIYVGIDNGVSGTIGAIYELSGDYFFQKVPVKSEQSYTKKKQNITRINHNRLYLDLRFMMGENNECARVMMERPFTGQFNKANTSAGRALESTLIALERLNISFQYMDSKEWQKHLLPRGLKGGDLKKASLDIACRLFPKYRDLIVAHGDGDGILIAEYLRRISR